jgi:hypothetical protein
LAEWAYKTIVSAFLCLFPLDTKTLELFDQFQ